MTSPAPRLFRETGLLRASAFGATKQRRQQAGSRSVAAARGEGRKALSANRLSSLTKLFLGNTGARAGDKPSRSHRISFRHAAGRRAAFPSLARAATAAGDLQSPDDPGRYFIQALKAPRIKLNNLSAHPQIPSVHSVARNSECGPEALADDGKLTARAGKVTAGSSNVAR